MATDLVLFDIKNENVVNETEEQPFDFVETDGKLNSSRIEDHNYWFG